MLPCNSFLVLASAALSRCRRVGWRVMIYQLRPQLACHKAKRTPLCLPSSLPSQPGRPAGPLLPPCLCPPSLHVTRKETPDPYRRNTQDYWPPPATLHPILKPNATSQGDHTVGAGLRAAHMLLVTSASFSPIPEHLVGCDRRPGKVDCHVSLYFRCKSQKSQTDKISSPSDHQRLRVQDPHTSSRRVSISISISIRGIHRPALKNANLGSEIAY